MVSIWFSDTVNNVLCSLINYHYQVHLMLLNSYSAEFLKIY